MSKHATITLEMWNEATTSQRQIWIDNNVLIRKEDIERLNTQIRGLNVLKDDIDIRIEQSARLKQIAFG